MVAAPVGVAAYVCHSRYACHRLRLDVREKLLPHWGEEHEVLAVAKIFLCDLQLRHKRRLLYFVEDWSVRLARLEVERTVLCLEYYVLTELSIDGQELGYRLLYAVFTLVLVAIDEATPHHYAAVGLQGIGKHVGTVGVTTVVVARTRLPFRVGLHEEAAEVRYHSIDLFCLRLPPFLNLRVERVGGLQVAENHGRGEVYRQIGLDAIFAQYVGNHLHLIYIFSGKHLRRGVDIVEYRTVDAYRGVGACVCFNLCPERRRAYHLLGRGALNLVP